MLQRRKQAAVDRLLDGVKAQQDIRLHPALAGKDRHIAQHQQIQHKEQQRAFVDLPEIPDDGIEKREQPHAGGQNQQRQEHKACAAHLRDDEHQRQRNHEIDHQQHDCQKRDGGTAGGPPGHRLKQIKIPAQQQNHNQQQLHGIH